MNAPTKKPALYALVDSYLVALDRVDPETGEIDAETQAVFEALTPQLEERIEACAAVRARFLAEAEANDELAKAYHAKSVARGREAERIERYVFEQLQRAGIDKVKGATATVWLQSNSRVEVDDITKLDPRFVRVVPEKYEADKKTIADALKSDEPVEGAHLVVSKSVRFK